MINAKLSRLKIVQAEVSLMNNFDLFLIFLFFVFVFSLGYFAAIGRLNRNRLFAPGTPGTPIDGSRRRRNRDISHNLGSQSRADLLDTSVLPLVKSSGTQRVQHEVLITCGEIFDLGRWNGSDDVQF